MAGTRCRGGWRPVEQVGMDVPASHLGTPGEVERWVHEVHVRQQIGHQLRPCGTGPARLVGRKGAAVSGHPGKPLRHGVGRRVGGDGAADEGMPLGARDPDQHVLAGQGGGRNGQQRRRRSCVRAATVARPAGGPAASKPSCSAAACASRMSGRLAPCSRAGRSAPSGSSSKRLEEGTACRRAVGRRGRLPAEPAALQQNTGHHRRSSGVQHQAGRGVGAGRLAAKGDARRIPAERGDVSRHPAQRHGLVRQRHVAGCDAGPAQPAERAEAVVGVHDDACRPPAASARRCTSPATRRRRRTRRRAARAAPGGAPHPRPGSTP